MFKAINDCVNTRPAIICNEVRQDYIFLSLEDREFCSNYNLYTEILHSIDHNEECNADITSKVIDILKFFDQIFQRNIKVLISSFINDQTIFKIIEIYLMSTDVEIIPCCLSIFCNFSYQVDDISPLYFDEIAIKMIGSINSLVPEISKYTRLAVSNLILDKRFFTLIPCDKWYEEFVQLKKESETIDKEDDINQIHLITIRLLYALLLNNYDPDLLADHIEYASGHLIDYYKLDSEFIDPDIPYFALRILEIALSPSIIFNEDKFKLILSLFTVDLIEKLSLIIGEEENSKSSTFILERLIEYNIDASPIFSFSLTLLTVLRSPIDTNSRKNLLYLFNIIIQKQFWIPAVEFLYSFADIANNGNFEERKLAILIICNIGHEVISNQTCFYPILIEFLSNNDNSIVVPILNLIRDLLYYSPKFVNYIVSNKDDMDTLYEYIIDPETSEIPECQEIILSINMLMQKIMQNLSA